jgi:hypothetical protein
MWGEDLLIDRLADEAPDGAADRTAERTADGAENECRHGLAASPGTGPSAKSPGDRPLRVTWRFNDPADPRIGVHEADLRPNRQMELIAGNRQQEDIARPWLRNAPKMNDQSALDFGAMVAAQAIIPADGRIGNCKGRQDQADAIQSRFYASALRSERCSDQLAGTRRIILPHGVRRLDTE